MKYKSKKSYYFKRKSYGEEPNFIVAAHRKKITAWISLLSAVAFILLLTGCTDYKQLKLDLLQAVSKQEDIKTYRFNGSVELKTGASLTGNTSPLATALFSMLKDSKIEYNGTGAPDQARMESDFKVPPPGGSEIDIPVLIKDNKLFFHIPALNKADEYMALTVQPAPSASANPSEPLKNTGRLSAALNRQLWSGIDPKWLHTAKEAVTLDDGTTAKPITMEINPKNEQAFLQFWEQSLPGIMELLQTNGLVSGASLDKWQSALKLIKFQTPSSVRILVDQEGFIREQKWDIAFTAGNNDRLNKLVWTHSLTDINKNPEFTKDIPAKQKSLDDLLKLIKPASPVK